MKRILVSLLAVLILNGCSLTDDVGWTEVVNEDPIISSLTVEKPTVKSGQSTTITCFASDEDLDNLTYSWTATGGTLSSTTGQFTSWTAPAQTGQFSVSVTVTDGRGGSVTGTATIIVVS